MINTKVNLENKFDNTQLALLQEIKDYEKANVRKVAESLGRSQPTVNYHLNRLWQGGYIQKKDKLGHWKLTYKGMEVVYPIEIVEKKRQKELEARTLLDKELQEITFNNPQNEGEQGPKDNVDLEQKKADIKNQQHSVSIIKHTNLFKTLLEFEQAFLLTNEQKRELRRFLLTCNDVYLDAETALIESLNDNIH